MPDIKMMTTKHDFKKEIVFAFARLNGTIDIVNYILLDTKTELISLQTKVYVVYVYKCAYPGSKPLFVVG